MRKQDSKRRWKARIRLGQWTPLYAIVQHGLGDMETIWEWDINGEIARKFQGLSSTGVYAPAKGAFVE